MAEKTQDLYLQQGKTQPLVLRCETVPIVYKTISAIQQTAPVRMTVTSHGIIDGWRAAVTNVKGMTEINSEANNLKDKDYHAVTVVDANTVEINDINAAGFKAYTSGGILQFNTPMDLAGYDARLEIRNKKNGDTVLYTMTVTNKLIAIDNTLKTVTLYFDAVPLSDLTWKKGYYELELFKTITRDGQSVVSVYSPLEGTVFLDVETTK